MLCSHACEVADATRTVRASRASAIRLCVSRTRKNPEIMSEDSPGKRGCPPHGEYVTEVSGVQTDSKANAVIIFLRNCWHPLLAIESTSEAYHSGRSSIW